MFDVLDSSYWPLCQESTQPGVAGKKRLEPKPSWHSLALAACCFSFWRRFFSPGRHTWQKVHMAPYWHPFVWWKAHGLHWPVPWLADPTEGTGFTGAGCIGCHGMVACGVYAGGGICSMGSSKRQRSKSLSIMPKFAKAFGRASSGSGGAPGGSSVKPGGAMGDAPERSERWEPAGERKSSKVVVFPGKRGRSGNWARFMPRGCSKWPKSPNISVFCSRSRPFSSIALTVSLAKLELAASASGGLAHAPGRLFCELPTDVLRDRPVPWPSWPGPEVSLTSSWNFCSAGRVKDVILEWVTMLMQLTIFEPLQGEAKRVQTWHILTMDFIQCKQQAGGQPKVTNRQ